ncbi:methyltransferase type 11 [Aminobacter sp. MSH1]|uniref:methyltransferase type 11 n=1 Tax=Aminobacter sp. MSH1 TaxID=374606 RepID=UPI000D38A06B|nr:methyltransferase type 11 [Aminobacter sp. MSH1]
MKRPRIYSRPDKPMQILVRRRERFDAPAVTEIAQPVVVDRATECHVTPGDVAARMVGYLGPQGDFLTLEPSAGTGQLVRALLASGHSRCELTMVERHRTLALALEKLGPCWNRCFLEYAEEARGRIEFPRIIMNPPFRDVRKHVAAALSLLGRGGHGEPATLVALVPCAFEHPEAETLEDLPDDTFAAAKVRTKIIRIQR